MMSPLRSVALLASLSCAFAATADQIFPADGWVDSPDPIASPFARKGGLIRFNGSQAPKSLNAYIDNNNYTRMTFALMYESLLSANPITSELVPCLARRWTISDDAKTFTFEIDPRAKWSDGVPVDAEDVKWTFDQIMTTPDAGSYQSILAGFYSPEVITNAGEEIHRTIRFRVKHSGRHWRDLVNCGLFEIMPRHAFENQKFESLNLLNAVVSGPYRLTHVEEQIESDFTRREDWWRADFPSCRNTMNFDKITMRYYSDNENAFEALKKGAIDVYPVYTARIMANETHGEKFYKNWIVKRRVHNHKPVGFQGFAMNMRRPPFDDLRVRQAICMLIDRPTMNRTLMFSEYFLLQSYFTDLFDAKHPCHNKLWEFDIAGAKKLLAEAGWKPNPTTGIIEKNGRPLSFTFLSRDGSEDKFLALFNASLREVGIKMKITRKDFAGWMRDMDAFNYDMTWASWSAVVFRDPEPLWASSEATRHSGNNIAGLIDPELDHLIQEEKAVFSVAKRNDYYRRMDAIISSHVPYAMLWNIAAVRLLYWNKFGMPPTVLDRFNDESSILTYWWFDFDSAKELAEAKRDGSFLPRVAVDVEYDTVAPDAARQL